MLASGKIQRRRSCRTSRIANRLSVSATNSGTGDWLGAGGETSGETGLLAPSTVDFACAAASLAAAASSPLVAIRCCMPRGCSTGLAGAGSALFAGAFLATAFLAGAFLAGAFFADAFLAGAFALLSTALAGGFLAGGVDPPSSDSLSGGSWGSAMRPLLCSFLRDFSVGTKVTRVPSCQDQWRCPAHWGLLGSPGGR